MHASRYFRKLQLHVIDERLINSDNGIVYECVLVAQVDRKPHFTAKLETIRKISQVTSYKRLTLYPDAVTLLIRSYRSIRFNCPGFSP